MKPASKQQRRPARSVRLQQTLSRCQAHVCVVGCACLAFALVHLVTAPAARTNNSRATQQQRQQLPGAAVPVADAMTEWIHSNDGVVNVAVRDVPGQGRITVAAHDFAPGDTLAAIPMKLCFIAHEDERAAAAMLSAAMRNDSAPHAPYLRTLPARDGVWSYYDMPASYLPLLYNDAMANAVVKLQQQLQQTWQNGGRAFAPDIREAFAAATLDDLRYSASLLKTRSFSGDAGTMMVPVVDMANHDNSCKHTITVHKNCGPKAPGGCLVWRAGSHVAAGSEVCNIYHDPMRQDKALLQYGFLQAGVPLEELSGIDSPSFDPVRPWEFGDADARNASAAPATDSQAELERLTQLLAGLEAQERELAGLQPDPARDADGRVLQQLLAWRRQRKTAIGTQLRQLSSASAAA